MVETHVCQNELITWNLEQGNKSFVSLWFASGRSYILFLFVQKYDKV